MIVVDTSVVIAVLINEPEGDVFRRILSMSDDSVISAVSLLEATQVASRWGDAAAVSGVDGVVGAFDIAIVPFTEAQSVIAREAFLNFGKGRGHPAQLNQMDCISYALAKSLGAPLLFKGDDFAKTDIVAAA